MSYQNKLEVSDGSILNNNQSTVNRFDKVFLKTACSLNRPKLKKRNKNFKVFVKIQSSH